MKVKSLKISLSTAKQPNVGYKWFKLVQNVIVCHAKIRWYGWPKTSTADTIQWMDEILDCFGATRRTTKFSFLDKFGRSLVLKNSPDRIQDLSSQAHYGYTWFKAPGSVDLRSADARWRCNLLRNARSDWLTLSCEVHKESQDCTQHVQCQILTLILSEKPLLRFPGKPNSVALGAQSSLRASQNLNIKG